MTKLSWVAAVTLAIGGCSSKGGDPQAMQAMRAAAVKATKELAMEAYPIWASTHPGTECPAGLADIATADYAKDALDPWGHPYAMTCGRSAPAAAHGFGVSSAGDDGKAGTADDVNSWEP